MKIEIWSDVMCPFCYIGKRKFENALAKFEGKSHITIEWKSFQLNPNMKTDPDKSISQYLAEIKGWSLEQAQVMNQSVVEIARHVGLQYNMDKAVVANSFDAHRVVQLAKTKGKGDAMEERLFKGYFTEGLNIADHQTLVKIGNEIGLDSSEISEVLNTTAFVDEVNGDVKEAQELGVRGVPFFVIDRKYGVSGAQESETFLNALNKAWEENIVKN
jgi:predicted DsbA family dithiol-disulfide isomerase